MLSELDSANDACLWLIAPSLGIVLWQRPESSLARVQKLPFARSLYFRVALRSRPISSPRALSPRQFPSDSFSFCPRPLRM
jgi:hypothetical protein